jgi:AAA+ superfamily predicted ATPase
MEPYKDSIEHLRHELGRLDLLLQRALLVARKTDPTQVADDFRGLVISEPEIEALVQAKDFFGERWRRQEASHEELSRIDQQLDTMRQEIDERRKLTAEAGTWLSLPHLAGRFNLSPAEVDVLLLAVAAELEPNYETLYAYLQNDVTRKHPSVNLALNLICRSEREKLDGRALFSPSSSLFISSLLELAEEPYDRQPPLLRRFIRMDEAVVAFLLNHMPSSAGVGTLVQPRSAERASELDPQTSKRLRNLATHLSRADSHGLGIRLIGQSDNALCGAAEILAATLGRRLLTVELSQVGSDEMAVRKLFRNAALWGAIVGIRDREPVAGSSEEKTVQSQVYLWDTLRNFREPILLLGPDTAFSRTPTDVRIWRLEVEMPGYQMRRQTWETALRATASRADASRLADTFRFGGERINQTIETARGLVAVRNPSQSHLETQDLLDAGRVLTSPQVGRFAIRIEPRYTWTDIVLPQEKANQLRKIAAWMKYRRQVHRDWGFGEKLSRGKGLNVLFTGPSGTGKTMAAEVLAAELQLDLYQIDLSSVVSKYIGETEKNLSAIFREAEQSQALLFFDEADALFGKRTEVKDAHDRYANIEVNYLLQRVEQYEGVVILATNLQQNLDDAFLRRMQEVLEFPFPDDVLRERIWRGHLPTNAPRETDIDFSFLAQKFKMTGGNIKNIVLGAAFLAAQDSKPISMSHLILSTKAEYQKEGKLAIKTDFGPYYDLIKRTA